MQVINDCRLPGKFKVWIAQFALLPRIMWPLTIYEIALSQAEEIKMKISKVVSNWLGVPKALCLRAFYLLSAPLAVGKKWMVHGGGCPTKPTGTVA